MLIKPNGTIRDQFKIPPKLIDTYNEIPISEKNCFSRRSTHYLQVYLFAIFSNDCERFCVLIWKNFVQVKTVGLTSVNFIFPFSKMDGYCYGVQFLSSSSNCVLKWSFEKLSQYGPNVILSSTKIAIPHFSFLSSLSSGRSRMNRRNSSQEQNEVTESRASHSRRVWLSSSAEAAWNFTMRRVQFSHHERSLKGLCRSLFRTLVFRVSSSIQYIWPQSQGKVGI